MGNIIFVNILSRATDNLYVFSCFPTWITRRWCN